jgi:hypothetical protein
MDSKYKDELAEKYKEDMNQYKEDIEAWAKKYKVSDNINGAKSVAWDTKVEK